MYETGSFVTHDGIPGFGIAVVDRVIGDRLHLQHNGTKRVFDVTHPSSLRFRAATPEESQGAIKSSVPPATVYRKLTAGGGTNHDRVFFYLLAAGARGIIADEAAAIMEAEDGDGRPKVNRVAPVLTEFAHNALVRRSGVRTTRNGSSAKVHCLIGGNPSGFREVYGREPRL